MTSTFETIEKQLNRLVDQRHSPSVQYIHFSCEHYLYGYRKGFADLKKPKKVTGETTFPLYSVTKTFTAMAVLQLAEKSLLTIEDPINKYLPRIPLKKTVTIKHLLTHTSGLDNPLPLRWTHTEKEHDAFRSNDFFKNIINQSASTADDPGRKFRYSNLGYVILGQLIEAVSKSPYEKYITENIINRLNPDSNRLAFSIPDTDNHATGYHHRNSFSMLLLRLIMDTKNTMGETNGKWKSFNTAYINGTSYGGLIANTGGIIKYAQDILKENSILLSGRYKTRMFEENKTTNGKNTGMCLSWFKSNLDGYTYCTHAGGGGGFYCELRLYPELQKGSFIVLNRSGFSDRRMLDHFDGLLINADEISREINPEFL